MTAPTRLHLPVQIDIETLQVGTVYGSGLGDNPLRDVRARVQLGAADGAEHRIDALSAVWDRLEARGAASIATRLPFALDLKLEVSQVQAPPTASGSATLVCTGRPTRSADLEYQRAGARHVNASSAVADCTSRFATLRRLASGRPPGSDPRTRPVGTEPLGAGHRADRSSDSSEHSV